MTINKTFENGILTLSFEGWFNTETAPEADPFISNLDEGTEHLIFDFDKLEYISSAGLRKVAAAAKNARGIGADFKIINVGLAVMSVLKMTGFTDKFTIEAK